MLGVVEIKCRTFIKWDCAGLSIGIWSVAAVETKSFVLHMARYLASIDGDAKTEVRAIREAKVSDHPSLRDGLHQDGGNPHD